MPASLMAGNKNCPHGSWEQSYRNHRKLNPLPEGENLTIEMT